MVKPTSVPYAPGQHARWKNQNPPPPGSTGDGRHPLSVMNHAIMEISLYRRISALLPPSYSPPPLSSTFEMVQLDSVPPPTVPSTDIPAKGGPPMAAPSTSMFDGMPVPQALHNYDREREVSTTSTTLEYPGGLIVTTTVEVRLKKANGYSIVYDSNDSPVPLAEHDAQAVTAPAPSVEPYRVPLPTSFRRPSNEDDFKRFNVVAKGKKVGIFLGEWEEVVAPLVRGVSQNKAQAYGTWDDAVYQYARAYQGLREGWKVTVLRSPVPVEFDESYQWGSGEKLGTVDITGLDLDPKLVTEIALGEIA
ncbi:hypothetical protein V5O48_014990 [Marasmius crinis-equi]|uniref:Uncharacterized protein n=1 Tax=Marasmius crinis-equi TaxID=585013 RepID=A0ABR3EVR6_9AGAR